MLSSSLSQRVSRPRKPIKPSYLPFFQLSQLANKRFALCRVNVLEGGELLDELFCVGLHVGELSDCLVTAVVDVVHAFAEVAYFEVHGIVENDAVGVELG